MNEPRSHGPSSRPTGRLRRRAEDGAIFIEALVFMVIIGIVTSVYVTSNSAMTGSMNNVQAHDIATQATHGVLEEALSSSWEQVGLAPADGPDRVGTAWTVRTTSPAFRSVETKEIRGRDITIRLSIYWKEGTHKFLGAGGTLRPCSGPAECSSASGYGTKVITARASWRENDGTLQTRQQTVERTSNPDEALSVPVPSGPGNLPAFVPSPTLEPNPTAFDSEPPDDFIDTDGIITPQP